MVEARQILKAILIPIFLALGAYLFGIVIFKQPHYLSNELESSYCFDCYPVLSRIYLCFVLGLLSLSVILPFLLILRNKPIKEQQSILPKE
jgi:hypothetical protein